MPQFFYKAKKGPKDIVSGYMSADSVADIVAKLALLGQVPFEIKPVQASEVKVSLVPGRQVLCSAQTPVMLAALTRQLADLLNAEAKETNGQNMWEARTWTDLPAGKQSLYRSSWHWKP